MTWVGSVGRIQSTSPLIGVDTRSETCRQDSKLKALQPFANQAYLQLLSDLPLRMHAIRVYMRVRASSDIYLLM